MGHPDTPEEYKERIKRHAPSSPLLKNCTLAFLVGGLICVLGEALCLLLTRMGVPQEDAPTWVTVILIFLAAFLTGIGVFDTLARYAGAGTLVPVTGFANSVVSPAMDAKSEGPVVGVGAAIFKIAGPVILFATLCGTLYGFIYYIVGLF